MWITMKIGKFILIIQVHQKKKDSSFLTQLVSISFYNSNSLNRIKLELAKYYKDSEMTSFISERSRKSKLLKKYDFSFLGGSYFFNYFEFLLFSEIKAVISESLQNFANSSFRSQLVCNRMFTLFFLSSRDENGIQSQFWNMLVKRIPKHHLHNWFDEG